MGRTGESTSSSRGDSPWLSKFLVYDAGLTLSELDMPSAGPSSLSMTSRSFPSSHQSEARIAFWPEMPIPKRLSEVLKKLNHQFQNGR